MKSSKNPFEVMVKTLLYIVPEACPDCGGVMHAWRAKNKDGTDRCPPVCMSCGYKARKKIQDLDAVKRSRESLKARAINYLTYSSLYTDKQLIQRRFGTFKTVDDETKLAFELAKRMATEVLLEKPIHMVLSGKSGVGKSHLAMATAWEVLEKSNYNKRCLFISYAELLEQLKFAMNDEQARKEITGSLMAEIKSADFVVLDDLGAELGVKQFDDRNKSTNFNNDTLNRIVEARQNKATVFTTNLTGKELSQAYGERIVSRIMNHSKGFVFSIKASKDKRIVGI
ncbi:ATP-binding protein [Enterococcus faecalis]|uniref:ATP-binding protein n=1 Tax=Enterococcus TaxID=1350 RepID=UPI00053BFEFD|nr:ATP-binding protein [Enterococcus faecalis]EGO7969824.1 ATP-binding protein [Enterococcus faecalis]EGO8308798.1 ATP-binding protein [Enterococcus faecalis]KII54132.1 DNA replication protein DnaC [Enterococcus faecalis]RXV19874.1 ATP-binding protein [Enterococcus faecalis]RXV22374.1 ATP-binding protein [Enterococcus faecalis]